MNWLIKEKLWLLDSINIYCSFDLSNRDNPTVGYVAEYFWITKGIAEWILERLDFENWLVGSEERVFPMETLIDLIGRFLDNCSVIELIG